MRSIAGWSVVIVIRKWPIPTTRCYHMYMYQVFGIGILNIGLQFRAKGAINLSIAS